MSDTPSSLQSKVILELETALESRPDVMTAIKAIGREIVNSGMSLEDCK